MRMLLTVNIFLDIVSIIIFHGRTLITHLKDTFSDSYAIKVSIINAFMVLKYYNLLIIKLKKMKKDTIKGLIIEDISQECIKSSLVFKYTLIRRSHISRESIPFEVLMLLLVP